MRKEENDYKKLSKEDLFKSWAAQYNCFSFIESDPIQFPHRYNNRMDIEVSAFVTAWLSYGNRKAIIKEAEFVDQDLFKGTPYNYIMGSFYDWKKYEGDEARLYRFFTYADFYNLCERLFTVYTKYENMEIYLLSVMKKLKVDLLTALQLSFGTVKGIPNNTSLSACKRLCLFLRWMVRNDGIVDLGLWESFSPKDLIIPVDIHVYRVAFSTGITTKKQANMKAALEITEYFKNIFPKDPALGDFSLFGVDIDAKNK